MKKLSKLPATDTLLKSCILVEELKTMTYKTNYKTILILFITMALFGCAPNLVKSISYDYKNTFDENDEYVKSGNIDNHLRAREATREKYLEHFFENNHITDDRLFLIEIYNIVSHRMDVYLYAEKLDMEKYYLLDPQTPSNSVYEFTPSENFDVDTYRFYVKKAKEGNFDELSKGAINYPSSSGGVVYLVIIDYKNKREFEIVKSIVFPWFSEY